MMQALAKKVNSAKTLYMKSEERLQALSKYEKFSEPELVERILSAKQRSGSSLVILGHHYQRQQIIKLSDFVGDSYGLSEKAADSEAQNIVFCGVRFMAESAAILSRPSQRVYHPDPDAGCPMADMANIEQVNEAWESLVKATSRKAVPITYMNSTAELKAFCGEKGGIVCTSSNAEKTFHWAFARGEKIFFFPDEHLGRNTARKFGISELEIVVWDPHKIQGGVSAQDLDRARVILWKGYCPVHMEFKERDVKHIRQHYATAKIIVHPECEEGVVRLADASGSTDFIVKYVAGQPAGSIIFVGTEVNLVTRLQKEFPDKKIFKLQRSLCLTMYQIQLANLCFTLENLEKLETVDLSHNVKLYARVALDRMLQVARS